MIKKTEKLKYIFLVGGETAGPIMPLLAIAESWRQIDKLITPIFIDVRKSVAKQNVITSGFTFETIIAGKLRRYWSIRTIITPVKIIIGFVQSIFLLMKYKPIVVVGAGGYVQFPVVVAAYIFRIPIVIHQQDIVTTLSNALVSPLARKITTTFQKSVKDFSQGSGFTKDYTKHNKVVWTGNPVRSAIKTSTKAAMRNQALKFFDLKNDWPTLLVIGGGSGAAGLNDVILSGADDLLKVVQVLHSTGQGKEIRLSHDRYHQHPFIERMDLAYAAADIVIARAGIGTITELSALNKVSILIPMPDTHQEANAEFIYSQKAAIVLDQAEITPKALVVVIRKILFDVELTKKLQKNMGSIMPVDSTEKVINVIKGVLK